jgi:hypothetical protein
MTEPRPPAEATVAALTALALAASWVLVAHTDAARDAASAADNAQVLVRAPPAPGLVAAPAPRRVVVVRRRSRAS